MGTATSEGHLPARSLMMLKILMILMKMMKVASSERHLPARSLMVMMMMMMMVMMKVASSGGQLLLFVQSLNNNFGCVQILTDIWEGEGEDFTNQIEQCSMNMPLLI